MAVVERKRKKGTVYYAVNDWHGKQVSELVGTSKRDAGIRDRQMKREIKNGTYTGKDASKVNTVHQECEAWIAKRTNASAKDEERHLRLHVLSRPWLAEMRLEDVRPLHIDKLIDELRSDKKPDKERRLSDKTIANILGTFALVFVAAVRADRCTRNPVIIERGSLSRCVSKEREPYSVPEVRVLIGNASIPWPVRVLNALVFLAGLREGEAVGRRMRDLSPAPALACLTVDSQYGDRELKTKRPRRVPVHPELATILEAWVSEGFELCTGKKPTPDDFIVPNVSSRARSRNHTKSSYSKLFIKYASVVGIKNRTLHAARHTFISLCRRAGCNKEHLTIITHNPKGDIVDTYTHIDWKPLCNVVLSLNLDEIDVHQDIHRGIGIPENSNASHGALCHSNTAKALNSAVIAPTSIPGASTAFRYKTSASKKTRQEIRQESERILDESREDNRRRKRRLLSLSEANPEAAGPGLALCRALDAAYSGDTPAAVEQLSKATRLLGGAS